MSWGHERSKGEPRPTPPRRGGPHRKSMVLRRLHPVGAVICRSTSSRDAAGRVRAEMFAHVGVRRHVARAPAMLAAATAAARHEMPWRLCRHAVVAARGDNPQSSRFGLKPAIFDKFGFTATSTHRPGNAIAGPRDRTLIQWYVYGVDKSNADPRRPALGIDGGIPGARCRRARALRGGGVPAIGRGEGPC